MNHGFAVEAESLPDNARPTHKSLFDGSLCGIELTDRKRSASNIIPKRARGRRTAPICSASSWRCCGRALHTEALGKTTLRSTRSLAFAAAVLVF